MHDWKLSSHPMIAFLLTSARRYIVRESCVAEKAMCLFHWRPMILKALAFGRRRFWPLWWHCVYPWLMNLTTTRILFATLNLTLWVAWCNTVNQRFIWSHFQILHREQATLSWGNFLAFHASYLDSTVARLVSNPCCWTGRCHVRSCPRQHFGNAKCILSVRWLLVTTRPPRQSHEQIVWACLKRSTMRASLRDMRVPSAQTAQSHNWSSSVLPSNVFQLNSLPSGKGNVSTSPQRRFRCLQ